MTRAARADVPAVYLDPLLYVLGVIAVMITLTVAARPGHQSDFIIFWDAARWQLAGHDLYSAPYRLGWEGLRPNLAAPALLVLIVPLTLLPVHLAHGVWIGFGVACYAVSAFWIGRELDIPMVRILAILLICPATVISLSSGSFAAPLTLAVTRTWLEHRRGRDVSSGLWMGAALFCKPFLLPFIGYGIIRGYARLSAGLLGGIAVALVTGVIAFGASNTMLWIHTVPTVPANAIGSHLNGTWMGFLTRAGLTGIARLACWLAGSLMIAAVLLWRWRRSQVHVDAEWLGAMAGGLLASPVAWEYYAPLLVAPFTAHRSRLRWVGYALFCLPWDTTQTAALASSPLAWRLTMGSAHFWGYLVFFVASLRDSMVPKSGPVETAASL